MARDIFIGKDNIAMERVLLEAVKVGAQVSIPQHILHTMEVQTWVNEFTRHVTVQFSGWFAAEHLAPEQVEVSFRRWVPVDDQAAVHMPATWWDHWKFQHPVWRRRLHLKPVRWIGSTRHLKPRQVMVEVSETVTIERMLGYPDSSRMMAPADWGRPMYMERVVQG